MNDTGDEQPDRAPIARPREEFRRTQAHSADRAQEAGAEGSAQGSAGAGPEVKKRGGARKRGRPRGSKNLKSAPAVDDGKVMTLQEVADYLLCHYTTIYRMVRRGELPAFRLGSDFRFRRSDIDKWIAEQHGPAGSRPEARKQKPAAKKPAPRNGRSRK